MPRTEKVIYLTFDDGPTAGVTEPILELLAQYDAKGTFFCLGKNAGQQPELVMRIVQEGHRIGSHGHEHLDGWKTKGTRYWADYCLAEGTLGAILGQSPTLFRPPYGRILPAMARKIRKSGAKIVLWDILTGDFDPQAPKEGLWKKINPEIQPGSILVLHDSQKSKENALFLLKKILLLAKEKGWECKSLPVC